MLLLTVSCKTETEQQRQLLQEKATFEAATTVEKTPMMLETSVLGQIQKKDEMHEFVNALSDDLKEILMGTEGPYTIFVPVNAAMHSAPVNTIDAVGLKKYIVKGKMTTSVLVKRIREHKGGYTFMSIAGTKYTAKRDDLEIVIINETGDTAYLRQTDYLAENGVVHTISKMLE